MVIALPVIPASAGITGKAMKLFKTKESKMPFINEECPSAESFDFANDNQDLVSEFRAGLYSNKRGNVVFSDYVSAKIYNDSLTC